MRHSFLVNRRIRYNSQVLHGARRTLRALPARGASNQGWLEEAGC